MVKGLDLFKIHFEDFADHYVLIGGAACYLGMTEAGLDFRVTKDLDIVLCMEAEALDTVFVQAFWDFVRKGGYHNRQKSTGKKLFYRFYGPLNKDFPEMLELFSRIPNALQLHEDAHLTPIPVEDEASSLSAILLDDVYYRFIQECKGMTGGVTVVPPEGLIPLKAKAWLELTRIYQAGKDLNQKDIKKHKNDMFRLFQIISQDMRMALPKPIAHDLSRFLASVETDPPQSLKPFGLGNIQVSEVIDTLRAIYELSL
ncbi:MAG: hypothetical protein K9N10_19615 [Deltaproteobacteria bacterium]|nr:hypothetical protein [Deltaproteobacteria bacterium]